MSSLHHERSVTLKFDMQDEDSAKREYLIRLFQQFAIDGNFSYIDDYVNDCNTLIGSDFEQWGRYESGRYDEYNEMVNGIMVVTHAIDLCSDYVDYLMQNGNKWELYQ